MQLLLLIITQITDEQNTAVQMFSCINVYSENINKAQILRQSEKWQRNLIILNSNKIQSKQQPAAIHTTNKHNKTIKVHLLIILTNVYKNKRYIANSITYSLTCTPAHHLQCKRTIMPSSSQRLLGIVVYSRTVNFCIKTMDLQ